MAKTAEESAAARKAAAAKKTTAATVTPEAVEAEVIGTEVGAKGLNFRVAITVVKKESAATSYKDYSFPDVEPDSIKALQKIIGCSAALVVKFPGKKIVTITSQGINIEFDAGSPATAPLAVAMVAEKIIALGGSHIENLLEDEETPNMLGARVLQAIGLPVQLFGGSTDAMRQGVKNWQKAKDAGVREQKITQKAFFEQLKAKALLEEANRKQILLNGPTA